jgi:diguanylate cyclase (GGDEF)-like protein
MARKFHDIAKSGRTILLVDDNREYLEATRLVLEREGHAVITAESGEEALAAARSADVDLMLLDYYMPGMTGEEVLVELRKFNPGLQVILQTGYASENPSRELLKRLDIQGYFDKSEGPESLLLWTDVGLKTAASLRLLEKSRLGLGYILSATPELCKIQPIESLLHAFLWRVSGLLGAVNALPSIALEGADAAAAANGGNAAESHGIPVVDAFLAMPGDDGHLAVRAGVGRFSARESLAEGILEQCADRVHAAVGKGSLESAPGATVVPLKAGNLIVGVVYLEKEILYPADRELLLVFANQAAVAIQNAQLYEMATVDPLTGTFVRRFFGQCVLRSLKSASRSLKPVGVIMVDMDNMKPINDTAGHLAGDRALVELALVLKDSIRSSDFIGRFGGDEFSILLPDSSFEGVNLVAARILESLENREFSYPGGSISLKVSIGIALLEPPESVFEQASPVFWQALSEYVQNEADLSLYEAKRGGKGCAGQPHVIAWPAADLAPSLADGVDSLSVE